jgi:hypothetical protein
MRQSAAIRTRRETYVCYFRFCVPPNGLTNPDSITTANGNIFVVYANATMPDGTGGFSTIVEYSPSGGILHTFDVTGKADGLKYNPLDHKLWALRNEDSNPALTLIDPKSGLKTDYTYPQLPTPHGGGYDVDDYFTPEINSSANPVAPTDSIQPDWTTDNLLTQNYDEYKVEAVLNWINGHRHDGSGNPGTPAIFGMNFQSVSTGQKLPTSRTELDLSGTAKGGYLADGATPGPVLSNALDFVDQSLGKMVGALAERGLLNRTAIIVSAKHGQSPMNPAALNRISDGKIIAALNAGWNGIHPSAKPLVALGVDDDGILLWLNDRSTAATDYARQFLLHYQDTSVDGKPVTSAGLLQVYTGWLRRSSSASI